MSTTNNNLYMSKADIQRNQVHDAHMKLVIIRLDYSGVIDSSELIKIFDKRFPRAFQNRNYVVAKEISLALRKDDFNSISEAVSVPVSVIEKERIVRYSGLNNTSGDVTFDISQFYICMTIKYNENYDGFNNYVQYFKGAISLFKDSVAYFSPKRLGIRKCRVETFSQKEMLNSVFEPFVFDDSNLPIGNLGDSLREYRAYLQNDNLNNIRVNIIRRIMPVTENGERKLNTILDIDVYYQDGRLLCERDINNLLDEANQFEFEVYKMCMTENVLLGR